MEQHVMTYEGPWMAGKKSGRLILKADGDFGEYADESIMECLHRRGQEPAKGEDGARWLRIDVHLVEPVSEGEPN